MSGMRDDMLRVDGPNMDPDRFFEAHSLVPEVVWRKGELDRKGRQCAMSGFNVLVSDNEDPEANLTEIERFLESHQSMFTALREEAGDAELDIGVTVGSDNQFTASVSVEPRLLARLASLGITLCVSAYPCSD